MLIFISQSLLFEMGNILELSQKSESDQGLDRKSANSDGHSNLFGLRSSLTEGEELTDKLHLMPNTVKAP